MCVICTICQISSGQLNKEFQRDEACDSYGRKYKCLENFCEETWRNRLIENKRRCENNIKMDIKEIKLELELELD
jgi:hypothetical protein